MGKREFFYAGLALVIGAGCLAIGWSFNAILAGVLVALVYSAVKDAKALCQQRDRAHTGRALPIQKRGATRQPVPPPTPKP